MKSLIFAMMLALGATFAQPAKACETALAFLIDVSASVEPEEFDTQMQGIANALEDPYIVQGVVSGQVSLMLMQWSASYFQRVSIPWTQITSELELAEFADAVRNTTRANSDGTTAVGEAILQAGNEFANAPYCTRRVIDISGDGKNNEGIEPIRIDYTHRNLAGVMINAIVLDRNGDNGPYASYYRDYVIRGEGSFSLTATSYAQFEELMRIKIREELALQLVDMR